MKTEHVPSDVYPGWIVRLLRRAFPPRKVRCWEDFAPPDKPLTRVWTVFNAKTASEATEAVGLLAAEGSEHPYYPNAKADRLYIDVQFDKRAWRVHVDYTDSVAPLRLRQRLLYVEGNPERMKKMNLGAETNGDE